MATDSQHASFLFAGGDKAGREPWRSAAALCWETGHEYAALAEDNALIFEAWQRRVNSPSPLPSAAYSMLQLHSRLCAPRPVSKVRSDGVGSAE